jgi:hypothetical protein
VTGANLVLDGLVASEAAIHLIEQLAVFRRAGLEHQSILIGLDDAQIALQIGGLFGAEQVLAGKMAVAPVAPPQLCSSQYELSLPTRSEVIWT